MRSSGGTDTFEQVPPSGMTIKVFKANILMAFNPLMVYQYFLRSIFCPIFLVNISLLMGAIHQKFARKKVGDTEKRAKH